MDGTSKSEWQQKRETVIAALIVLQDELARVRLAARGRHDFESMTGDQLAQAVEEVTAQVKMRGAAGVRRSQFRAIDGGKPSR